MPNKAMSKGILSTGKKLEGTRTTSYGERIVGKSKIIF
jgi:hypothetical protein